MNDERTIRRLAEDAGYEGDEVEAIVDEWADYENRKADEEQMEMAR